MALVYLGLGANLDNPKAQLEKAIEALRLLPQSQLVQVSSFYGSKPQGPLDQPDYVNAVAELRTRLSPLELLNALQAQEQAQGRIKLRHWGERSIDLDILLYDDLILNTERLSIPHKELCNRSFVVTPLLELCPDLRLPNGDLLSQIQVKFEGELHKLSR